MVDDGFSAITEERDLDFAEKALPGNIKLLEVMLKSDPDNERILLRSSARATAATRWRIWRTAFRIVRAISTTGGIDYGLRILRQDNDLAKALDGTPDDLKAALEKKDEDLVPGGVLDGIRMGELHFSEPGQSGCHRRPAPCRSAHGVRA